MSPLSNKVTSKQKQAENDETLTTDRPGAVANFVHVCGIVAALRPEKNHELFLEAAKNIWRQHPETKFVIVGDGPDRGKLEALAQTSGIGESVHFLGTRSDIPQLLAAFDLFLLTSHNEANPVSILEAMATGLPVVSTQVGSVAESVADRRSGFLVSPGDAGAFAEKVDLLLTQPDIAHCMGMVGREIVTAQWSLERMVQGYEDLLCSLYSRKAGGGVAVGRQQAERSCGSSAIEVDV